MELTSTVLKKTRWTCSYTVNFSSFFFLRYLTLNCDNPPTAELNTDLGAWSKLNKSYTPARKTQHSHLNGTKFQSDNFHQQQENFQMHVGNVPQRM